MNRVVLKCQVSRNAWSAKEEESWDLLCSACLHVVECSKQRAGSETAHQLCQSWSQGERWSGIEVKRAVNSLPGEGWVALQYQCTPSCGGLSKQWVATPLLPMPPLTKCRLHGQQLLAFHVIAALSVGELPRLVGTGVCFGRLAVALS